MNTAPQNPEPDADTTATGKRKQIVAAGAVVLRHGPSGPEVLLVHRPHLNDWSLPKGKLDRGESLPTCAVREVREETGVEVFLTARLSDVHYPTDRGPKVVHWWRAAPLPNGDAEPRPRDGEVDAVQWLPVAEALTRFSYANDADVLREALTRETAPGTVVFVRHTKAIARSDWSEPDPLRPLTATGLADTAAVADTLAAFGVQDVITSPSVRCVQTVTEYATRTGLTLQHEPRLSEEDAETDPTRPPAAARTAAQAAARDGRVLALCSHRPVLPLITGVLGADDVRLGLGEVLVVRLGADGQALETQGPYRLYHRAPKK